MFAPFATFVQAGYVVPVEKTTAPYGAVVVVLGYN